MASMELTPAESKEEGAEVANYQPKWAVSEMYLGDDAMKAVGLAEPPKPGTLVEFRGVARITSVSLRDDNTADPDQPECSMSMQPVSLEIAKPPADARTMFPKSKMEP